MLSDLEVVKGFKAGERLLRAKQVGEMLGVPVQTLAVWRHLRNRGKPSPDLPFIKIGRAVRYRLSDVQQFLEQNRHTKPGEVEAKNGCGCDKPLEHL